MVERIEQSFDEHGFGLFCAELIETGECIGFIGLNIPRIELPFTPCIEIGWRLASPQHGKGLATEGAKRVKELALSEMRVERLVSYTSALNLPSQNVMRKIGLARDESGDFLHPSLPEGHPLQPHVLFRLPA